MGFPWKAVLGIANAAVTTMFPLVGQAETAIVGIKKGQDRKKYVLDLAKVAPELAEQLSGHEIVDNILYEEALGNLNDGVFKLLKAVKPVTHGTVQPARG